MSNFDSPGVALETRPKRRLASSRFAEVGERIARKVSSFERVKGEPPTWAPGSDGEHPMAEEDVSTQSWEHLQSPFPLVRRGYDPATVDEYVAQLEHELDELHARTPDTQAVAHEFDRIGEQTAAILRVAHDKAQEVTRAAQVQADKCVADAAANAIAITEDANRRLQQLDAEADLVWQERARLVEDVRNVATALFSLADDAADRYPDEPEQPHRPAPDPEPVTEDVVHE